MRVKKLCAGMTPIAYFCQSFISLHLNIQIKDFVFYSAMSEYLIIPKEFRKLIYNELLYM